MANKIIVLGVNNNKKDDHGSILIFLVRVRLVHIQAGPKKI